MDSREDDSTTPSRPEENQGEEDGDNGQEMDLDFESKLPNPADQIESPKDPDAASRDPSTKKAVTASPSSPPRSSPFNLESTGPAEDEEMPLTAHIEEMLKRLGIVIAIAGIVSLVTFPLADQMINFLWNSILPQGELTRPRVYGILELKITELKVASLIGLIIALPVLVYQTYQFMRPGLYPHERRYYLAAVPTSLILALIGVSFAYFIILPVIFSYFLYYSQDVANIGFALGQTLNLMLLLMGYLAIVFQIPLMIMLAIMMNLVTRTWLIQRRILFWGGFLGIAFLFSPDPTGMAPLMVGVTMILLFEGTIFLTRWTEHA